MPTGAIEQPGGGRAGVHGFGRLPTDADGTCTFATIKPGPFAAPESAQAAHVNVCLFARGLLRQIYTRIYFAGDAGARRRSDPRARPGRRRAHAAWRDRRRPSRTRGTSSSVCREIDETVFFDL